MNQVILIGNLTTDVTTRPAGEQTTASFKLAVNRPGKDKGADFVWVKTWNGLADACARYLHGPDRDGNGRKASRVAVQGSIRTNRVQNDDGSYTEYVEVNARSVEFLDRRPDNGDSPAAAETLTPEPVAVGAPSDDDIPF